MYEIHIKSKVEWNVIAAHHTIIYLISNTFVSCLNFLFCIKYFIFNNLLNEAVDIFLNKPSIHMVIASCRSPARGNLVIVTMNPPYIYMYDRISSSFDSMIFGGHGPTSGLLLEWIDCSLVLLVWVNEWIVNIKSGKWIRTTRNVFYRFSVRWP